MRDFHDFGLDTVAVGADRCKFLRNHPGSESRNVLRNGNDVVGLTANSTGFDERHGTFSPGDSGIIGAFTEPSSENTALKSREADTGHSTNTPESASDQSVASLSCCKTKREPTVNFLTKEVARIVRAALLRDALAAIAEWQRASGADRAWCRRYAMQLLRRFRTEHLAPERAAFRAAVAASKQRHAA